MWMVIEHTTGWKYRTTTGLKGPIEYLQGWPANAAPRILFRDQEDIERFAATSNPWAGLIRLLRALPGTQYVFTEAELRSIATAEHIDLPAGSEDLLELGQHLIVNTPAPPLPMHTRLFQFESAWLDSHVNTLLSPGSHFSFHMMRYLWRTTRQEAMNSAERIMASDPHYCIGNWGRHELSIPKTKNVVRAVHSPSGTSRRAWFLATKHGFGEELPIEHLGEAETYYVQEKRCLLPKKLAPRLRHPVSRTIPFDVVAAGPTARPEPAKANR